MMLNVFEGGDEGFAMLAMVLCILGRVKLFGRVLLEPRKGHS